MQSCYLERIVVLVILLLPLLDLLGPAPVQLLLGAAHRPLPRCLQIYI